VTEQQTSLDPFTAAVLHKIDPQVFNSFTPDQKSAVQKAIAACRPLKGHPVDVRGTISLLLLKYYFVFLLGLDKRSGRKEVSHNRRNITSVIGKLLFTLYIIWPVYIIVLFFIYMFTYLPKIEF